MHKSKTKRVSVYSDGGARGNPGPAAIGVLVLDERGHKLEERRECLGRATNNVAEYQGVLKALELARGTGASCVTAFLDSELVVRQLNGIYRVKDACLGRLYRQVKESEKAFSAVSYTHLPRTHERIKAVDRLVNRALDEAAVHD